MATIAGSEASNTMISGDVGGILHERSVITADQVKIFRDLDEDFSDFRKKLKSWKVDLSEFSQPQSPLDSSPNKKSYERSSKTREVTYPVYKSLASKLGLSKDFMNKYTEFSYAVPALKFYNQKNGTNFKLLDTSHSRMFYFGGMWAHCVFQAALDDSPYTKDFFAEVLCHSATNEYEVKLLQHSLILNATNAPYVMA